MQAIIRRSLFRSIPRQMYAHKAASALTPQCLKEVSVQNFTKPYNSRSFSSGFDDDGEYFDAEDSFIQYPFPQAKIGQLAPTFKASALVDGEISTISLEKYRGKYVVLFFYPKDFTYVCPTEIIAFNDRVKEFEALDTKVICASTDTPECHLAWTKVSRDKGGLGKMTIPMIADTTKIIASKYGTLNEEVGIAFRGLFIIDRDGILQQSTINNFPVGRSVDETLRLVKAFQFNEEHGEVCPANWQPGSATIKANPKDSQEYFSKIKSK